MHFPNLPWRHICEHISLQVFPLIDVSFSISEERCGEGTRFEGWVLRFRRKPPRLYLLYPNPGQKSQ